MAGSLATMRNYNMNANLVCNIDHLYGKLYKCSPDEWQLESIVHDNSWS